MLFLKKIHKLMLLLVVKLFSLRIKLGRRNKVKFVNRKNKLMLLVKLMKIMILKMLRLINVVFLLELMFLNIFLM